MKFYLIFFSFILSAISFSQEKKQNILFIGVDDMRPLINSYGHSQMKTPNIDKLASEGIQFNQAYTNIAVCGASRASILTGVRGSQSRFVSYYSRADEDLPKAIDLAGIFKKNGYKTFSIGKIYHHGDDNKKNWDFFRPFQNQKDYKNPESITKIEKRNEYHPTNKNQIKTPPFEYADVDDFAYNDGKVTETAINNLKTLKDSKEPFFMAVGYISTHLPFIQPKKYKSLYSDDDLVFSNERTIPKNAPSRAVHEWTELRNAYLDIPQSGPVSQQMEEDLIRAYYSTVSYLDALIGKLLKSLDDFGLRDNTTIVFWSDHGFFLGEHGFWCKHHTFQEAIHVPLLISSPGKKKNAVSNALVEYVDIYPTLCEIAGIDSPNYIHGKSMVPILENPNLRFKSEIYSRYQFREVVQDHDYSYHEILNYNKFYIDRQGNKKPTFDSDVNVAGYMLFDMKNDKQQTIDISKNPEHAEHVKKYSTKLLEMRDFSNKPIIIK